MSAALQQRTPEWHQARRGKVTASKFRQILLGGEQAWQSYMKELDEGAPQFTSEPTEWGNKYESSARARFELKYQRVQTVGVITHPDYPMIGASPDFLVGNDAGSEIKCPFNPENHFNVLLSQTAPEEY